jgi:hypothetical protein
MAKISARQAAKEFQVPSKPLNSFFFVVDAANQLMIGESPHLDG